MKILDLFEMLARPTPEETREWAKEVEHRLGLTEFDVWQHSNGDLKLNLLIVPKGQRKQGIGSQAMDELTNYADRHGFRIVLSTGMKDTQSGTTSRSRLQKFYKRFGLVRNRGRNKDFTISDGMYRTPRNRGNHNQSDTQGLQP
jgi:GNAT superfamily N-acetyltransferase